MSEYETTEVAERTAGEWLADGRKEKNLSVADVASKLRIAPRQIEALEADDYARLPGHTIARGFVRNYARLLQLDPESVLAAFEKHSPKEVDARITLPDQNVQFSESSNGHYNRLVLWLSLGILLLTGLGYAVWRWEASTAPQVKIETPAVAPASQAAPKIEVAPAPTPSTAVEPAPVVAVPPSPPAVAENPPTAVADHVVHLAFDGDAWVEVRDQAGKVILKKNHLSGTEQDITAPPPLSFTIGNAAKVKMTYNGDAFDLTPHLQGTVARFRLER